ncbi:MAG: hypothetical protein R6X19_03290 [Kiritimatiellia bacterium]
MAFDLSWKPWRSDGTGAPPLLRFTAAAAWLAAGVLLLQCGLMSRELPQRLRTRLGDLAVLSDLDSRAASWQAARAAFLRETHAGPAIDFPARLASAAGAETNAVRELSRVRVAEGWDAVRFQFRAENMALAALSSLLEAGEAVDPPWRVTAISVVPVSPKPGRGRVTLEFECLAKTGTEASPPVAPSDHP